MAPTKLKIKAPRSTKTGLPQKPAPNGLQERIRGAESDDSMDKDETEERLEKLIFGDDAGFLDALKRPDYGNSQLVLHEDPSAEGSTEQLDEENLEDVADEDVRMHRLVFEAVH